MPQAYDLEQLDRELHERRVLASQSEYLAALLRSNRRQEALLERIALALESGATPEPAPAKPAPKKSSTRKRSTKG